MNDLPIYDEVLAQFGPLHEPVETDFVLLVSQAVLALVERQPT